MTSRIHSVLSTMLEKPMTRRSAIRTFALSGAAMTSIATIRQAVAQGETERHTSQLYTVTTASNFRSGPGTTYSVVSVIQKGTTFTLTAQERNGFYGVNYKGTTGWIFAELIVAAGQSAPGGDPVMVGEASTSTDVNLRSGPSTSHNVLRVVPSGAAIQVSNTVQGGFRYVVHQGLAGWMSDQYIRWTTGPGTGTGTTFTTTAYLNLRAEPSMSARVLLVMPEGATVTAGDGGSNGFRKVTYKGTTGWAATAYLN